IRASDDDATADEDGLGSDVVLISLCLGYNDGSGGRRWRLDTRRERLTAGGRESASSSRLWARITTPSSSISWRHRASNSCSRLWDSKKQRRKITSALLLILRRRCGGSSPAASTQ